MARYFAQLNNTDEVERVIVADSKEWCVEHLGGVWEETFMDTPGKNYAGKGHKFHADKNNFAGPQPYNSWTLDEKLQWKAPKIKPEKQINGKDVLFTWNEDTLSWVEVINLN